uniref:Microtubule associated scaffold protein 1 n=1 Tax=Rhinolophus ferrumequinum TaxID=59479 RepID=A0A671F271_RHIFE
MGCSSSKMCLYSPCAATRQEEALKQHKTLSQELVNLRGELA